MNIERNLNKAFRIIRRNYSCPGSDGLSYHTIKENFSFHRNKLAASITGDSLTFYEPRKKLIYTGKITKKVREVFIYNIYDRWVQEAIKIELNKYLQKFIHPHVYSYIRGKNRKQAFDYILNSNPAYILILDIKDFSGSIDKPNMFLMLKNASVPLKLIAYVSASIKHIAKGLPKGNPISSTLSNFYLSQLDFLFAENYARYSDDLIWGLKSEAEVDLILAQVAPMLAELKLHLNHGKMKLVKNNGDLRIIQEYPWIIK